MSNNLTRKGLAVSSGLAIALTSLVGVAPATAAAGDVTVSPTDGDSWSVFNSDTFSYDTTLKANDDTFFTSEGGDGLGLQFTNTEDQAFVVTFPIYDENEDAYLDMVAFDADGDIVYDSRAYVAEDSSTYRDDLPLLVWDDSEALSFGGIGTAGFLIDFELLGATRVHVFGFDESVDNTDGDNYADLYGEVDVVNDDEFDFTFSVKPYVYDASEDNYDPATYGDGDFSIDVRSWLEISFTGNYETVESNWRSSLETIEFLDPENVTLSPRIERFVEAAFDAEDLAEDINYGEDELLYEDSFLNGHEDYLGFSVAFPTGLNLEQTNLDNWSYEVRQNGDIDDTGTLDEDDVTPATGADNRVYVYSDAYAEDAGDRFRVNVYFDDTFEIGEDQPSNEFRVPAGSATEGEDGDVDDIFILPASGMVHSQGADDDIQGEDSVFELPTTQKTTTYNLQLVENEDAVSFANVPVAVIVAQYGDLDEDSTITVSNANYVIDSVLGAVVASGVTDASGKWTFTVTHSSATAGEGYALIPAMADESGYWRDGTNYGVTYAAAAPSEITPSSTLLAGTSVSVSFTVTDQFGRAVSKAGTKDLFVGLTSSDGEDLDLSAAVSAAGEATFTFTNYLATAGSSDTLLAQVYTGTATNPSSAGLPSVTVDLYNAKAADSVSAPTSLNAVVTYGDFITGKASATNVAPASADGVALTATVRDAAGLGIPGAIATVSGTGLQFKDAAGNYAKDSISVVANSNGQFTVTVWTHEANANGKAVTVTSGGKTASTLIKSYLPTGLNGDVLDFKFTTIPTEISKNTTYSVTAKLTDKWGNPVATQGLNSYAVVFESSGSVQLNSTWDPIVRNFGRDGSVTVFLRAAADVAGDGEITARITGGTYEAWTGSAVGTSTLTDLGLNSVNNPATAWDETKWTPELVNTVKVLNVAPVTGKVNVGSFNGKLVVYAAGLNGKTISWKVGGVWGKAVANSDYVRFDRPTPRRGVDVKVEIYVDKQLLLTKTVRTR